MEEAAYVGTLVGIAALSELHLRVSRVVGVLVLITAVFRACDECGSKQTPWITCVKIAYVFLAVAVVFAEKESMQRLLLSHLVRLNVIVMAYPPLLDGDYSLAALIVWLTLLTPSAFYSQREYQWAYVTVILHTILITEPFRNARCFGTLTLLPMLVPLVRGQAVKDVVVYRCIGMLVMISLPEVWSRSVPLDGTQFRSTPVKTSWNRMEDALAAVFDDPHPALRTALVLGNVWMCACVPIK